MLASADSLMEKETFLSLETTRVNSINTPPASPLELFASNQVDFVCIPDFLQSSAVTLLQQDILALKNLGFGASAGIATNHIQSARRNVHQIWLHSPGSRSPDYFGGFLEARRHLLRTIDALRHSLNNDGSWGTMPPEMMELSYLSYPPGASYFRHVDTFNNGDYDRGYKRRVSMILFLGDPTDARPWDADQDGGCLRVYEDVNNDDGICRDIEPNPGTLVLFDSATVPHEVLETLRTRACVVGWFNTYT